MNRVFLDMIRRRVIEVRPDGTVWKLRNLNRIPLPTPRRMETQGKNGYLLVKVCWRGKQFLTGAHQLVWTVLRGPIPRGLEPNHEDGDKTNNRPSNLKLMTRGKNHEHAYATGLRQRSDMAKDLSLFAKRLRAQGLTFVTIGKKLGVSQTTAFRAVQYRRAAHGKKK